MGSIDVIIGCMFSGKSSRIIELKNKYTILNKKILTFKHSLDDTRYKTNNLVTHNNITSECISIDNLSEIITNKKYDYINCDVIIIEEGQFFNNLYNFSKNAADIDNKIVIIAGLDGNSNRDPFGDILKLIPICTSVTKLHALCKKCNDGTKACFTKRKPTNKSDQILVGVDEFEAVCRKHYLVK